MLSWLLFELKAKMRVQKIKTATITPPSPVAGLGKLSKVLHDALRGAGFKNHATQRAAKPRLPERLPFRAPTLVHDLTEHPARKGKQ